ncbi:MAG: hypothetical protein WDN27_04610 [Candidatus Saccharibacteria bacterium]
MALSDITRYLPLVLWTIAALSVCYLAVHIGFSSLQWRRVLRRKSVTLELTPPANTARAPRATQELFNVIHGFRASRTIQAKLLRRNVVLSFEITSTRASGIRYLVQVDEHLASSLQQAITSYLPQVKVNEIQDMLPADMQIIEFKETGHYAFPLAAADFLEDRDPVAYLAGAMTKLASDEQMRVQLVLTPVQLKEATALARRILNNEDLLARLHGKRLPFSLGIAQLLSKGLFSAADAIGEVYHGPTKHSNDNSGSARKDFERMQISTRMRPARTLSAFELELMETMHKKLNQPLFRASIRIGVCMDKPDTARERLAAIKTSLQAYSVPSYQTLHTRLTARPIRKLRYFALLTSYRHSLHGTRWYCHLPSLPACTTSHLVISHKLIILSLHSAGLCPRPYH